MSLYLRVRESGGSGRPGVNWSVPVPPVGVSCLFLKPMVVTHSCSSRKIRNLNSHVKSHDFLFHYFSYVLCNIFTFYFEITSDLQESAETVQKSSHVLRRSTGDKSPHMLTFAYACFIILYVYLCLFLCFSLTFRESELNY